MNIDELKNELVAFSYSEGDKGKYISNNSINNALFVYKGKGVNLPRFEDVEYNVHLINDYEEIVVFDLKENGKYYIYLKFDKIEEENIGYIGDIKKLEAQAYGEINNKLLKKKQTIDDFLEKIFDEELDMTLTLINTFAIAN